MDKMWLYIVTRAPYGDHMPSDAPFDAIMATAAFGQPVQVVLAGAGKAYLDPSLEPPEGCTDLRKHLRALPLYGIERLLVDEWPSHPIVISNDLEVESIDSETLRSLVVDAANTVVFS